MLHLGRLAEAEVVLEEALQLKLASLGEDDPGLVSSMLYLARLDLAKGNMTAAEARLLGALDLARQADRAPTGWPVAAVWHELGRVSERQERWAEAEQAYRQALEAWEALGTDDSRSADALFRLAALRERQGDSTAAARLLDRAEQIRQPQ